MSLFHQILQKLQHGFTDEIEKRKQIAKIISSVVGISISQKECVLRNGTVYVHVVPTLKMAISLKRERIIKELKEQQISITSIQ